MNKSIGLETLKTIQKLENEINAFSKKQPQKPSFFDKRVKTCDTEKMAKSDVEKLNGMIREKWDLEKTLNPATHKLKKGDAVYYIDARDNGLKIGEVVRQGKCVNDYNDTSSFVRIKGGGYIWNQSRDSIVSK